MAIGVKALPISFAVHFLALLGAVLVLIWCISFRGGLAWASSDKSLIFNLDALLLSSPVRKTARNSILSYTLKADASDRELEMLRRVVLHPVLMLIGFVILGGEAIVSYKSLPLKKPEKKLIHLLLHAIALILGIIGIYTAFKFHNESNIANLYSLHSWLGIGVIVLYGIQWVYGFVVFFFPGGTPAIRSESLPWHVLFGTFVYVLAVVTATLGYLEKLTFLENSGLDKYGSEAFLVNFTAIVTVLFGTFVILTTLCQTPPEDEYSYSAI